ncbi:MAG: DUF4270 family protein [Bacteroidota bacterium]|nr:DUF4270 family protein [Bacteroidota bacterium]MEC8367218.1 DUF4270 family protein [Bacteroidota bacterium]MEC8601985.1 DUF4270 family protein [Bacteroidota bacterium]
MINKIYNYQLIFILFIFYSCSKDYNSIGTDILKSDTFNTSVENIPVYATQKLISPFKSNGLSSYQLGQINDNIFGKFESSFVTQLRLSQYDPLFGIWDSDKEKNGDTNNIKVIQENENVTKVVLEIPFFNNTIDSDGDGVIDLYDVDSNDINSDSDGDGVSDIQERANGTNPLNPDTDGDGINDNLDTESINPDDGSTVYDIDSLIGNIDATFKIKIQELDYYLRNYDPNNNFETFQKYYSDDHFIKDFTNKILHDDFVALDTSEITIYEEDDPDTDEVDESTLVKERLSPRIIIPLDIPFFQSNIIDKEGSIDLLNQDNFNLYIKGLLLSAYDFSDDLLMILDYNNARIKITYEYDVYNDNDTTDDTSDDVIDKAEKDFEILLAGNQINLIKKGNFIQPILDNVSLGENLKTGYLKGGQGAMLELDLFTENNGVNILDEIKSKGWLINEANLTVYIDQKTIGSYGGLVEPSRLYLYDMETQTPLIDYFVDNTTGQKESDKKINHDGLIQYDSDKKGVKYKIRISEYIKNIIRNDSISNKLGLVVSSSIDNSQNLELRDNIGLNIIPITSAVNPLGTIIYGPNPDQENYDKRLRLELYYTEINN